MSKQVVMDISEFINAAKTTLGNQARDPDAPVVPKKLSREFNEEIGAWVYVLRGPQGGIQHYRALVALDRETGIWVMSTLKPVELEEGQELDIGQDPWIEEFTEAKGGLLEIINSRRTNAALLDKNGNRLYVDSVDNYGWGVQAVPKRPGVDTSDPVSAFNERFESRAERNARQFQYGNRRRQWGSGGRTSSFPDASGRQIED